VPLTIHVEQYGGGGPAAAPAWIEAQIDRASVLFAPAGIGFSQQAGAPPA